MDKTGDRKEYSKQSLRHLAQDTGISKSAAVQVKKLLRLGHTEQSFRNYS
jgi:hypothetical protein